MAGLVIFLIAESPNAEAAVREACAKTGAVDSYDLAMTTTVDADGQAITFHLDMRISGNKRHGTLTVKAIPDHPEGGGVEQIYDGADTRYIRKLGTQDWEILPSGGDMDLPFPYNAEALCPVVDSATLLGNKEIDGVNTRQFQVAAEDDTWLISINDEGWIVQTEEIAAEEAEPSDVPYFVTVISGIGEPNEIDIPVADIVAK